MNVERLIVSRHQAAVEFIKQHPGWADAFAKADVNSGDVRGKIVAGNLPLHLAALCREVWALEFSGKPPRGSEYSLDDMRAAGARLVPYTVQKGGERALLTALLADGYTCTSSAHFADVVAAVAKRVAS